MKTLLLSKLRVTRHFIRKNWLYRTFTDESRKENIICAYGNAGYYVPRKDNCGREFDYWL